jgi:hypothetical protein
MKAIDVIERTPEQLQIEAEVRRICSDMDWCDTDAIRHVRSAVAYGMFMRDTEPLRQMQAKMVGMHLRPRPVVLNPNGTLAFEDVLFPPEVQQALNAWAEEMTRVALRYGLAIGVHPGTGCTKSNHSR